MIKKFDDMFDKHTEIITVACIAVCRVIKRFSYWDNMLSSVFKQL